MYRYLRQWAQAVAPVPISIWWPVRYGHPSHWQWSLQLEDTGRQCLQGPITHTAQTTSKSNSCSTLNLQHLWTHGSARGRLYASMGVQKLYKASPTPILYVGLAADVLGRAPLMPLFLLGNSTPTISHQLRQHRSARFPQGLTDAAD